MTSNFRLLGVATLVGATLASSSSAAAQATGTNALPTVAKKDTAAIPAAWKKPSTTAAAGRGTALPQTAMQPAKAPEKVKPKAKTDSLPPKKD